MPTLHLEDGTTKEIKNLGWFNRHLQDVHFIEVHEQGDGAQLVAHLKEIGAKNQSAIFVSDFASRAVLRDFLQRKLSLRGTLLEWHAPTRVEQFSIGVCQLGITPSGYDFWKATTQNKIVIHTSRKGAPVPVWTIDNTRLERAILLAAYTVTEIWRDDKELGFLVTPR